LNIRRGITLQISLLIVLFAPFGFAQIDKNSGLSRFVIYGDTRTNQKVHRKVVLAAVEQHPDFIVQTGDLVANSNSAAQWRNFDRIIEPVRKSNIGYYPARGNHDVGKRSKYAEEMPASLHSGNIFYYRFDIQNLRFLALDTESDLSVKSGQYKWLEKELKDARTENKFVVPFFHQAIFSVGDRHGSNVLLQSILHPLFKQYGVRLVFQGHDHIYYRTTRDGIVYRSQAAEALRSTISSLPSCILETLQNGCITSVWPIYFTMR
jgi:acid phosphatase type 7